MKFTLKKIERSDVACFKRNTIPELNSTTSKKEKTKEREIRHR